jgi:hypothetical protein
MPGVREIPRPNKPLDDYLSDIQTIKAILAEYDEMGCIETWAFFSWAALVAAGVGVSLWIGSVARWTYSQLYFRLWVPLVALGGVLECIAWAVRLRRQSRPVLGSRFRKSIIATFFALVIGLILSYFVLEPGLPTPALLVLLGALMISLLAVLSYTGFLVEAAVTLVVGVVLLFVPYTTATLVFAGFYTAAGMAACGMHQYVIEKKPRG